jgi:hypothetical protein
MPAFPEFLNTDGNGTETSAVYASGAWKLPSTVADGDDVALGAKADAAVTDPASSGSLVALLKGLLGLRKVEDVAHATGDAGIMALAVRKDTAAASSGTTGDYEPLSTDSAGRLRTVAKRDPTDALSLVHMAAEAASQVVKASAGTLHSIVGYVASGESGWIQVHDATSAPANGAVPELAYYVGAASAHQAVNIPLPGHVCATGITLVWSTTGPTKTTGASKLMVAAYYE